MRVPCRSLRRAFRTIRAPASGCCLPSWWLSWHPLQASLVSMALVAPEALLSLKWPCCFVAIIVWPSLHYHCCMTVIAWPSLPGQHCMAIIPPSLHRAQLARIGLGLIAENAQQTLQQQVGFWEVFVGNFLSYCALFKRYCTRFAT